MAQEAQKILHFYCFKCKDYELKTSPHYRRIVRDPRAALFRHFSSGMNCSA
jgi:hypothetical protein